MAVFEVIRSIPWVQPLHHRAPTSTHYPRQIHCPWQHQVLLNFHFSVASFLGTGKPLGSDAPMTRFPDLSRLPRRAVGPAVDHPITGSPDLPIRCEVSR